MSTDENVGGRDRFLDRIRVVAHPVRIDIVDALMVLGSASSTELGRLVPEAKASMRWHVTQLEEAEFIRRLEGGQGRAVVWEPTRDPLAWSSSSAGDPEVTLAVAELERVMTDRRRRRMGEWAIAQAQRPWVGTEWPDAAVSRDYLVGHAQPADLSWLDSELAELMDRFKARVAGAETATTEAVFVTLAAFPWRPRGRP